MHIKLFENFDNNISEALRYHLDSGVCLLENVFRYGSEGYMNLINEARSAHEAGLIELSKDDTHLLSTTDIGRKGIYEGNEVWLDMPFDALHEAEYKGKKVKLNKPMRGGSKKFYVYTKNDKGNVIKVSFGAKSGGAKLAVKLKDPQARADFARRHDCENKNDKTTPGYWSCRLPRYAKQLGLSGGGKWW